MIHVTKKPVILFPSHPTIQKKQKITNPPKKSPVPANPTSTTSTKPQTPPSPHPPQHSAACDELRPEIDEARRAHPLHQHRGDTSHASSSTEPQVTQESRGIGFSGFLGFGFLVLFGGGVLVKGQVGWVLLLDFFVGVVVFFKKTLVFEWFLKESAVQGHLCPLDSLRSWI